MKTDIPLTSTPIAPHLSGTQVFSQQSQISPTYIQSEITSPILSKSLQNPITESKLEIKEIGMPFESQKFDKEVSNKASEDVVPSLTEIAMETMNFLDETKKSSAYPKEFVMQSKDSSTVMDSYASSPSPVPVTSNSNPIEASLDQKKSSDIIEEEIDHGDVDEEIIEDEDPLLLESKRLAAERAHRAQLEKEREERRQQRLSRSGRRHRIDDDEF
jgi:hypothetical protein